MDLNVDIQNRWDPNAFSMPRRMGQLKSLDKFDADFMGVNGKQAAQMDPRLRIILELTHEATLDAGVNPFKLRGSKTGVYLGTSGEEAAEVFKNQSDNPSGYTATGACLSMIANRISFTFDLNGPSMVIDTACSSSLLALLEAMVGIRNGLCDAAIVAGINLCLDPRSTLIFTNLGMTSMEGKCRSFDVAGEGYARSEAAVVIYICKSQDARRFYVTIVHGKTNSDGYKPQGATFPSGIMQEKLLREVYFEAGINPIDVEYIEAHGTGTQAGDTEEVNAISRVFCDGRDSDKPLMIGAVKSNMGHPEPAAGLCQIAKVILSHQHGIIPGNLHYLNPNPNIPALLDARIKVVDKNTIFNGCLVGINSFGFGGTNVHILLKLSPSEDCHSEQQEIPVIVPFSGRTAMVEFSLEKLMRYKNPNLIFHLQDIHSTNIPGHNFRSYGINNGSEISIQYAEMDNFKFPQIWFIFSGMGAQYISMARDMMKFKIFRTSIKNSVATLKNCDFNLKNVLNNKEDGIFDDVINSFVSIIALQIALVDLTNAMGILPDGIIGHSLGEVSSAYADGCLTASQTVRVALARGRAFNKAKFPGAMATVGLTWAEAEIKCPENVYPACHNAEDNITVSGPANLIAEVVNDLKKEGVFARAVQSSGFAFHSKYMNPTEPFLREYLCEIVPVRTIRTSRWISTSVPNKWKNTSLDKYCSIEYFVNNTLSPVRFYEGLQHIPQNSIVIEIASRNFMQTIIKRSLQDTVSYFALMNHKVQDNVLHCLDCFGQLYLKGCLPKLNVLYDAVKLPSPPVVPMISPAIFWDHKETWTVPINCEDSEGGGSKIQISLDEAPFYSGHIIDGRNIFPVTGYMWLVWTTFAKQKRKKYEQFSVVMEKLRFERNTMLPKTGFVEFGVNIRPNTGDFEVYENDSAVFHGNIRELNESDDLFSPQEELINNNDATFLYADDWYKELQLRGYNYSGVFRGVHKVVTNGTWAEVIWQNNWVGFMDTLLQIMMSEKSHGLLSPIRLQEVIINPRIFLDFVIINSLIPVSMLNEANVISVPGIELRGLTTSIIPTGPASHGSQLSMHSFVPYIESHLSIHHCLEYFLEIVMDNTPYPRFAFVEIQDSMKGVMFVDLLPRLLSQFANTSVTLVTESTQPEFESHRPTVISMSEIASIKEANLVVTSGDTRFVNKIVAEKGFIILCGELRECFLPEFQLVSCNLENQLRLYVKITQLFSMEKSHLFVTNKNFDWVEKLKQLLVGDSARIFLYSVGVESYGLIGFIRCMRREGYNHIRCYSIEDNSFEIDFEAPSHDLNQRVCLDLVFNVYKNNTWGCFCNLSLSPEIWGKPRPVAESFVNCLNPGDMSTLHWIESPFGHEQIDTLVCKNYYASLNFRDVMFVSGKLSKDALPNHLLLHECVLGTEFCGTLDGKYICGQEEAKCFATCITLEKYPFILDVPKPWSLVEAATIPIAYSTAYYALVIRARMLEGETVLIHAGSGGVGQAAIAIALSMKCRVFTTVSTAEKRQCLKNRFPNLEDASFADSRNASSFEKHVMRMTKWQGVDIILNSLAQEKLEASLRCLAKNGRFLEIGKFDLFNNTSLGMQIFLRNIQFDGIVLDDVLKGKNRSKAKLLTLIKAGIQNGNVQPLSFTLFSHNQLEEAFRFMATAKHVGKVVLSLRDNSSNILAFPRTYFHREMCYVIVGGLGGMGLEIGNFMVLRGAHNLVLVSRSGITTGYQAYRINAWQNQGVKVIIDSSDVSTQAGAEKALQTASSLGPVGGIFNLAVELRDTMFQHQTAENFEIVGRSKILATIELDKASRILAPTINHFVCFSSIVSSRGNAGQTNYAFANSFMESVCEDRCKKGLPGLAIQWGAVGDVGILHNQMGGKDVSFAGFFPQKISSCLETLDLFLRQSHPVLSSFIYDTSITTKTRGTESIIDSVGHVMAIKNIEKVNRESSLIALGMDSLMATEIKMLVENKTGISLPAAKVGELTFSKLRQMETSEMKFTLADPHLEFKPVILQPMPYEAIVKMPSKGTSPITLFIVHSLDGNISQLEPLMRELNVNVYGLQCTKEAPLDSIEALAGFYIIQIKTIQDSGPYHIGGYSYGAAVALELTIQLERQGEIVENLLLLDGCHVGPKLFTQVYIQNGVNRDDVAWLLYFIFLHRPTNAGSDKIKADISALQGWEKRLNKTAEVLHEYYPTFSFDQIRDSASSFANRINAGYSYEPSGKVNCRTSLIRASATGFDKKLGNDYQLNQVCERPVNVLVVEGGHYCFHEQPLEFGIPEMMNDILIA